MRAPKGAADESWSRVTPTGQPRFCSPALQIRTTLPGPGLRIQGGIPRNEGDFNQTIFPPKEPSGTSVTVQQLQRAATFRECLFVPSPVGSFKPSGKADGTGVMTTPVLQVRLCRDSLPLIPEEGTETGRGVPKVH